MITRGPALLLLLLLFLPLAGFGQEGRTLTILYSASLNGNLDGCACREAPRAGLVKRAAWLKALPPGERRRSVLLDAGDLLDAYPDDLLAGEILPVYRELGYDAISLGDQDLVNGIEAALSYRERGPWMAHNLAVCPDDSRCIFFSTDPLLLERAGVRVGLFALLDPGVFALYPPETRRKLKLQPPGPVAGNLAAQARAERAEIVVLLYHGAFESAIELAREVEGIDVIIVGHEQRLVDAYREGRTILASPGEEGNRLGVLRLSLAAGGTRSFSNRFQLFEYSVDPDDPEVRKRIERYRRQMRARLSGD